MKTQQSKGVGTGFLISGMLAMLVTTAFQAVYPAFSTRTDAISFLGGVGEPTAIFWNATIVVVGLLWILSSYILFKGSGKKVSSIVFYLAGAGFILVGISPWDLYPLTHSIGAHLVAIFGALGSLLAFRFTGSNFSKFSLAAGTISLLALFGGYLGLGILFGSGGDERLIFYPILLWEIGFGGYLLGIAQEK